MVQPASNLRFTVEAVEQHRIALGFRMRHFDRDLRTGTGVGRAIDRRHAAPAHEFVEQEVVQTVAGMKGRHDTTVAARPLERRKEGVGNS